ncbi:MAG: Uma2 family endonuclease [Clostridiales bacterium]|nr:Uma2 family endonuclease [Clostridiales bacterium]
MPLLKEHYYTSDDYWNLPEHCRAELIDGQFYDMAPPGLGHQRLIAQLTRIIGNYIASHRGDCEVIPAPFAVNLDASDKNWVEPDISVICDKSKLTEKECIGAPDWIIEVVSPGSRKHDYSRKNMLYLEAGVREYWIVDPDKGRTTVYRYEQDAAPTIFAFDQEIEVGIYHGFAITVADLLLSKV